MRCQPSTKLTQDPWAVSRFCTPQDQGKSNQIKQPVNEPQHDAGNTVRHTRLYPMHGLAPCSMVRSFRSIATHRDYQRVLTTMSLPE
jgi:hypothetical protein